MPDPLLTDPLLAPVPQVEGYKVLAPCVLFAKVGQGGMGAVFRAMHLNLNVEVCVKCLLPRVSAGDEEMVQRFRQEAQLAALIAHQNVVRVYDVQQRYGLHYLVMEYVRGDSVSDWVERRGRLEPGEAVTIVLGAARGLAAAHELGIVHRDIKPDNILISTTGEVKLADLGLGAMRGATEGGVSGLTRTAVTMGTPRYMPPEQWTGLRNVGPEGDVWALGATFYFLCAGRSAFSAAGSQMELMQRICLAPFPNIEPEVPDLPKRLVEVLRRCTEVAPEKRYRNAGALVRALEEAADGLTASLIDAETGKGTSRSSRSHPPGRKVLERISSWLAENERDSRQGTTPFVPSDTETSRPATARATEPDSVEAEPPRRNRWLWAVLAAVLLAAGAGAYLLFFRSPQPEMDRSSILAGLRIDRPRADALVGSDQLEVSGTVEAGAMDVERIFVNEKPATFDRQRGSFAALVKGLAEGGHTITVEVEHDAGRRTTKTVDIRVDLYPPALQVERPANGAWLPSPVTFEGTVRDASLDEVSVGGEAVKPGGERWARVLKLDDGDQAIKVKATDALGRFAEMEVKLHVDSGEPIIVVKQPVDGSTCPASEVDVVFEINDAGEIAEVQAGGKSLALVATGAYTVNVPLPVVGENRLEIVARDRAGNRGTRVVRVIKKQYAGFAWERRSPQGFDEFRHEATGVLMVDLPGGSFEMGAPESDADAEADERPQRLVTLDPFLIAKYEVSQAEWEKVMGPGTNPTPAAMRDPALPVLKVSWDACVEFCDSSGLSLPSELEWEYACRAGTTTRFAFGDSVTAEQVNFASGKPDAAASGEANAFGLHHLHGNAYEWCKDFYDDTKLSRVQRGGSFRSGVSDGVKDCRSSARLGAAAAPPDSSVGFRPVWPRS